MEDLSLFIVKNIKQISSKKDIDLKTKISDLNFEYIDFIELCLEIEEEYEVFLDENLIEKKESVEDLVIYVANEIEALR